MEIVGALDVHRAQITYKTVELGSGETTRGRIVPATRASVRAWLERFDGVAAEFALEGTSGWRFVVEEIERAGLRISPIRPRRRPSAVASGGRRPTGPTVTCN